MIEHVICAKLPSSTVSEAKLNGPICGGSNEENKKMIHLITECVISNCKENFGLNAFTFL